MAKEYCVNITQVIYFFMFYMIIAHQGGLVVQR